MPRNKWTGLLLLFFSAHEWTVGVKHYIAGIADGGVLFIKAVVLSLTETETETENIDLQLTETEIETEIIFKTETELKL